MFDNLENAEGHALILAEVDVGEGVTYIEATSLTSVSEPSALALFGIGIVGMSFRQKRLRT